MVKNPYVPYPLDAFTNQELVELTEATGIGLATALYHIETTHIADPELREAWGKAKEAFQHVETLLTRKIIKEDKNGK